MLDLLDPGQEHLIVLPECQSLGQGLPKVFVLQGRDQGQNRQKVLELLNQGLDQDLVLQKVLEHLDQDLVLQRVLEHLNQGLDQDLSLQRVLELLNQGLVLQRVLEILNQGLDQGLVLQRVLELLNQGLDQGLVLQRVQELLDPSQGHCLQRVLELLNQGLYLQRVLELLNQGLVLQRVLELLNQGLDQGLVLQRVLERLNQGQGLQRVQEHLNPSPDQGQVLQGMQEPQNLDQDQAPLKVQEPLDQGHQRVDQGPDQVLLKAAELQGPDQGPSLALDQDLALPEVVEPQGQDQGQDRQKVEGLLDQGLGRPDRGQVAEVEEDQGRVLGLLQVQKGPVPDQGQLQGQSRGHDPEVPLDQRPDLDHVLDPSQGLILGQGPVQGQEEKVEQNLREIGQFFQTRRTKEHLNLQLKRLWLVMMKRRVLPMKDKQEAQRRVKKNLQINKITIRTKGLTIEVAARNIPACQISI
ncbi:unnamed protein product [Acanthoscelides obtectus]|uniref:Uncharacterized protein n=1 Tax=Acanthoscelides obtectus TaxID=200917 RepID=A0A9P0K8C6_ACAOB|nr:unnamed protein product [Acanthoscelides obtectus]CAK1622851.1 hypothetical protein AOBTE_LOCUS1697 [Acanthoscelides obtectus]